MTITTRLQLGSLLLCLLSCQSPSSTNTSTTTYPTNPIVVGVDSISLSASTLPLPLGVTRTLTVSFSPSNADNQSVAWASGSPGIATVDSRGLVTPVALGTAVVTATASGFTASCTVEVNRVGAVTTLVATGFYRPTGVATDGTNLYVADTTNHRIRKVVISTGVVTTLAGSGTSGAVNATGVAASFNGPTGIATDGTNLFVADTGNGLIRQIVIGSGVVTTLAGAFLGGSADGYGTNASFYIPTGVATDGVNVYVADQDNHAIRKIVVASGLVSTIAGSPLHTAGSSDGVGTAASFNFPVDVATDGTNLFVADSANSLIRQIVLATGQVTTLAGATTQGTADGVGSAARFGSPYGVATDGTYVYVADYLGNTIRQIVIATGRVTTVAGTRTSGASDGVSTAAGFSFPYRVAVTPSKPGALFVADYGNNLIREIQ